MGLSQHDLFNVAFDLLQNIWGILAIEMFMNIVSTHHFLVSPLFCHFLNISFRELPQVQATIFMQHIETISAGVGQATERMTWKAVHFARVGSYPALDTSTYFSLPGKF